MRFLPGHKGAVRCVAYSPDSRRLVSGDEEGVVHIHDLSSDTSKQLLSRQPIHSIEGVVFTSDGQRLIIGKGGPEGGISIRLCQHKRKGAEDLPGPSLGIRSLVLAPDRPIVFAAGWDRTLLTWEVSTEQGAAAVVRPFATDAKGTFTALAISPDGATLAAATWEGDLFLLDARTGKKKKTKRISDEDPIQTLAWSLDGNHLATAEQIGRVIVWKTTPSFDVAAVLEGHEWVVFGLAFGPGGRTVISGGADATVRVWDVAGRTERACYRWTGQCVTCLAVSPDGMTAAAGGAEGALVVWDLEE